MSLVNLGTAVALAYCIVIMFLMTLFLGKPEYPKSEERGESDDFN